MVVALLSGASPSAHFAGRTTTRTERTMQSRGPDAGRLRPRGPRRRWADGAGRRATRPVAEAGGRRRDRRPASCPPVAARGRSPPPAPDRRATGAAARRPPRPHPGTSARSGREPGARAAGDQPVAAGLPTTLRDRRPSGRPSTAGPAPRAAGGRRPAAQRRTIVIAAGRPRRARGAAAACRTHLGPRPDRTARLGRGGSGLLLILVAIQHRRHADRPPRRGAPLSEHRRHPDGAPLAARARPRRGRPAGRGPAPSRAR